MWTSRKSHSLAFVRARALPLAALAILVGGVAVASIFAGAARGGSDEPYVVRQVVTTRVESPRADRELVGELWTKVGSNGEAQAFVGRYYDAQGNLWQAQYRDEAGEVTFWQRNDGGPSGPVEACIEHAPPHPEGLEGLVPHRPVEDDIRSQGFTRDGVVGPPGLPQPFLAEPATQPRTSEDYDLAEATVWSRTLDREGTKRVSTMALAEDGTDIGWWSETFDPDGNRIAANSHVVSIVETYPASQFDHVLSEVDFDDVPPCW